MNEVDPGKSSHPEDAAEATGPYSPHSQPPPKGPTPSETGVTGATPSPLPSSSGFPFSPLEAAILAAQQGASDVAPDLTRAREFDILEELGRGGMGVVYRAYDRRRKVVVALKTLQGMAPHALYRFKQEFRSLAGLTHSNLLPLYELISDGRMWFFTMEYVAGVDFRTFVGGVAPSRIDRLRPALRQLAEGVAALHRAGKLHRDIKPHNVRVTKEGHVVLLDFGLAAELGREGLHEVTEQQLLGTVAYMSPEQGAARPLSPAADWYSVGVMLFEALTGKLPFIGSSVQVLADREKLAPPEPRDVAAGIPDDLNALCVELLRRDPHDRPTGQEVLRRLESMPTESGAAAFQQTSLWGMPLVGRQRHLAALQEAFQEVQGGRTVALFVHGSSGVGKSALVQSFLDSLPVGEAVILAGRCYEQESVPYKAFDSLVDSLSRYLAQLPAAELQALLPRDVAALMRVFPVMQELESAAAVSRRTSEVPDAQELRRRAFTALRELLTRLGDRRPVILSIDDLQWGDLDSAALLGDLLRPPDPPVLLAIGSYRSEEAATSAFLPVLFRGHAGAGLARRELAVDVLTPAEGKDLALALLGRVDPETAAQAEAIAQESGGNPFFVYELVHHLRAGEEVGSRPSAGERVALDSALWSRITLLPDEARRLLEVLAVAGRPLRRTDAALAADVGAGELKALAVLRSGHLIRSRASAEREEIETYHDRIRETVAARLSPVERKGHHQRIAAAIAATGQGDPEILAVHFQGAEEYQRAGECYAAAAARAANALAFDHAVKLFRRSLEVRPIAGAEGSRLRARLADALANAGYGAAAAREYLAAAADADATEALRLRQAAARQYLVSGHIDEGLAALRTVLSAVNMELPATPRRAFWLLVLRRLWLGFRGFGFRRQGAASATAEELTRLDICWSAATGLSIADVIRGAEFQTRHLLLALQTGDLSRIARALTFEASHSATDGGPSRRRTSRLMQVAESLVREVGQPYALAFLAWAKGVAAFLEGRWKNALQFCDEADGSFRGRCVGVTWELDTTHTFALWSLTYLGELAELGRRQPGLLKEAQERGDLFAATYLSTYIMAVLRLAADRPEEAQQELQEASSRWTQQGFHVQHHNMALGQVYIHLYNGAGRAALDKINEKWPAYRSSLLLHVQHTRIDMLAMRARSALVAAVPEKSDRLLRSAEADARRLERERMPWGNGYAQLIRAGIAAGRGDSVRAAPLFAAAAVTLDAADMRLHAAAARHRQGELLGGTAGQALIGEADAWMTAQEIRNPARFAAMLAPGFPPKAERA